MEEEDSRIYGDFADGLRESYPATSRVCTDMQAEESRHRQMLIDMYRQRFGEHIPLIRPQDVKGFIERKPTWLLRPLGIETVRKQVGALELETQRFYERALPKISDAATRKLLGDLAEIERQHSDFAGALEEKHLDHGARAEEEKSSRRLFMLQVIQPGLAGLMDGRYRPWLPFLRRPSLRTVPTTLFWWARRHLWARAFQWPLPRRYRTTARLQAAADRWCEG